MKIKRIVSLVLALILSTAAIAPAASAADATVSGWAQSEIAEAVGAGIVPDGLPTDYTQAITRAQFCKLAVALYETATSAAITGRVEFTDTSDVDVQKMAYLTVVNGYGGGIFGPNDPLPREQAAAILSHLAERLNISMYVASTPYTDVLSTNWAKDDIARVYSIGVMMGTSETAFDPSKSYTIEQSIATMLRLYKKAKDAPAPGIMIANGSCGDNVTWALDSNGLMTISGTGAMADYTISSACPWYASRSEIVHIVVKDGVTAIGDSAFYGCDSLISVNIPEGVTSIGRYAFSSCQSLTSITIPKSVSSIGEWAFASCNALTSITLAGAPTYTLNSLDDMGGFQEALFSIWPTILGVYVPVEHAEEYSAAVLRCVMVHRPVWVGTGTAINTIVKGPEYALILITYTYNDRYSDGMDILPYHQGHLNELNEDSVALYERAKTILSSIIAPGMNEYQKVKAIHDYLVKNTAYVGDRHNSNNAKGPILEGKAVCDGYAEAFQLLCVMSDIDCLYVVGGGKGYNHAWNKVKVDGVWYNVDVTFDDSNGGHKYFLISDSKLAKDHVWEEEYLPVCLSDYPN